MRNPLRRPGLVLPLAAAIIIGLCIYKTNQKHTRPTFIPTSRHPLPLNLHFELNDHSAARVRLARYLGRHEIVLVFFDTSSEKADGVLPFLKDRYSEFRNRGITLIGITASKPQDADDYPFEILTEMDLTTRSLSTVRRDYGLFDEATGEPQNGVFYIDRASRIAWEKDRPQPLPEPIAFLRQLIGQ